MAAVVRLGGTYRDVTVKSTALMIAVACFSMLIIIVMYELFGKKGLLCHLLGTFCILVTVESFFSPVEGIYYRYPSLAVVLAVCLMAAPLVLGKHEREKTGFFDKGITQEKVFLAVSLTAGIILACNTPVSSYNSWDDETHYQRIIYMSQGIYATQTEADIDLIYSPYISSKSEEKESFARRLDVEEETPGKVIAFSDSRAFFPDRIGYLGILFMTWLGRAFHLPFSVRYVLGRIGNLFIYTMVMYFAIRHLKRGKTLLTVLALAPTAVFLGSSYSYDPWVFAFSALSFSYFFRACENENAISWREIIIMVGSMCLAVLPKLPYTFLLIFLLLMPRERFEDKKQMRRYWGLIIFCGIALFILTYMSTFAIGNVADNRSGDEPVNAVGQIAYILSDVKSFLHLTVSYMSSFLRPTSLGNAFMRFGGSYACSGLITFYAALLVAAIVDGPSARAYVRILGVLISLAMAVILAWIFYLVFTPVGKNYISGCQPRYLVPIVFPFAGLIFGGYINKKSKVIEYIPVLVAICVLCVNVVKFIV